MRDWRRLVVAFALTTAIYIPAVAQQFAQVTNNNGLGCE